MARSRTRWGPLVDAMLTIDKRVTTRTALVAYGSIGSADRRARREARRAALHVQRSRRSGDRRCGRPSGGRVYISRRRTGAARLGGRSSRRSSATRSRTSPRTTRSTAPRVGARLQGGHGGRGGRRTQDKPTSSFQADRSASPTRTRPATTTTRWATCSSRSITGDPRARRARLRRAPRARAHLCTREHGAGSREEKALLDRLEAMPVGEIARRRAPRPRVRQRARADRVRRSRRVARGVKDTSHRRGADEADKARFPPPRRPAGGGGESPRR